MEASILLHLEDLSFFYPIIASKAGVVVLLSYSNCFTTPTLVDNYRIPMGINRWVYVKPGPWTGLDHGLDWTGLDWTGLCDIETRNPIRVFDFFLFTVFFHVE